jgi:nucleotide-binding universal stress UspA family protein
VRPPARALGLPAKSFLIAEDADVAETLLRVAREQDAPTLVIGGRHHGELSEAPLGSTGRSVLRSSPCPVLVVREDGDHENPDREEVP